MRSNTTTVDETEYSAPSRRTITLEYYIILEMFGVERAHSTVHDWVHKAELQPKAGRAPDHVAVDETVIRLNGQQCWLYAAIDPETNEFLHTKPRPHPNGGLAWLFLRELRSKHDVEDAVFLVDDSDSLQYGCWRHRLDFRYEPEGNRNNIERVFREVKRRTDAFSNSFSHPRATTADEWLRSFAFAWNRLI